MGPREPKEGNSKPMVIITNGKQAKMGQRSPKKGISKWYGNWAGEAQKI